MSWQCRRVFIDEFLEPLEIRTNRACFGARRRHDVAMTLSTADRFHKHSLRRRCIGRHRNSPLAWFCDTRQTGHVGIEVRNVLIADDALDVCGHNSPRLADCTLELLERKLPPSQIWTIRALTVQAVAVAAPVHHKVFPESLARLRVTLSKCCLRDKQRN